MDDTMGQQRNGRTRHESVNFAAGRWSIGKDAGGGAGQGVRQHTVQAHGIEVAPLLSKFVAVEKHLVTAYASGAPRQQTNRTPLSAHELSVTDVDAAGNNSGADRDGNLPRAVPQRVAVSFSQHTDGGLPSAPIVAGSHAQPPPVPVTAAGASPAAGVPVTAAGASPVPASSATDCGGPREDVGMAAWDEPDPVSKSGESCSVHSDALNAVFHQRFEFAPGALQLGGLYDSEQCYTYSGGECWVVTERSPARECATPDSSAPVLDDLGPPDVTPERHALLWQLRRAANLGRLSAPADSADDGAGDGDFGGGFGGSKFGGGGFSSGPWARRALDVAVDVANAAEWEAVSVLLHGDGMGDVVEAAGAELPSALVIYSPVTVGALDRHLTRCDAKALPAGLTALDALAPDKVDELLHSCALWTIAIVEDLKSLAQVALPHELKTTLGSLLLLAHVTLLPQSGLEDLVRESTTLGAPRRATATHCNTLQPILQQHSTHSVAVCCSVLQCVAVFVDESGRAASSRAAYIRYISHQFPNYFEHIFSDMYHTNFQIILSMFSVIYITPISKSF